MAKTKDTEFSPGASATSRPQGRPGPRQPSRMRTVQEALSDDGDDGRAAAKAERGRRSSAGDDAIRREQKAAREREMERRRRVMEDEEDEGLEDEDDESVEDEDDDEEESGDDEDDAGEDEDDDEDEDDSAKLRKFMDALERKPPPPPKSDHGEKKDEFKIELEDYDEDDDGVDKKTRKIPGQIRALHDHYSKIVSGLKQQVDRLTQDLGPISNRHEEGLLDEHLDSLKKYSIVFGKGATRNMDPKSITGKARRAMQDRLRKMDPERLQAMGVSGIDAVNSLAQLVFMKYEQAARKAAKKSGEDQEPDPKPKKKPKKLGLRKPASSKGDHSRRPPNVKQREHRAAVAIANKYNIPVR